MPANVAHGNRQEQQAQQTQEPLQSMGPLGEGP